MRLRAVILGDSIVGADADGSGGLGRALVEALPALGVEVVDVVGVGGSTVASWLVGSGLKCPGPGAVAGRWGSGTRMKPLDLAQRRRANLSRLARANADLYWINLGHNDFGNGRWGRVWAAQALALVEALPPHARVVWSVANDADRGRNRTSALEALRASAPQRVLVIDGLGGYRRSVVHPTLAAHRRWVDAQLDQVGQHLAPSRRDTIFEGLGALIGVLVALSGG